MKFVVTLFLCSWQLQVFSFSCATTANSLSRGKSAAQWAQTQILTQKSMSRMKFWYKFILSFFLDYKCVLFNTKNIKYTSLKDNKVKKYCEIKSKMKVLWLYQCGSFYHSHNSLLPLHIPFNLPHLSYMHPPLSLFISPTYSFSPCELLPFLKLMAFTSPPLLLSCSSLTSLTFFSVDRVLTYFSYKRIVPR